MLSMPSCLTTDFLWRRASSFNLRMGGVCHYCCEKPAAGEPVQIAHRPVHHHDHHDHHDPHKACNVGAVQFDSFKWGETETALSWCFGRVVETVDSTMWGSPSSAWWKFGPRSRMVSGLQCWTVKLRERWCSAWEMLDPMPSERAHRWCQPWQRFPSRSNPCDGRVVPPTYSWVKSCMCCSWWQELSYRYTVSLRLRELNLRCIWGVRHKYQDWMCWFVYSNPRVMAITWLHAIPTSAIDFF